MVQSLIGNFFGVLSTVIGLGLIVYLGSQFRLIRRLRSEGVGTTGTVVSHVPREEGLDQAVIRFEDQQGRQSEFTPSFALLNRFVPVGEQFTVIYLPDRPHKAKIMKEMNRRSLLPALFCALIFSSLGILILVGVLPSRGSVGSPGDPLLVLFCALSLSVSLFIVLYAAWSIRRLYVLHRDGLRVTGTVTRTVETKGGSSVSAGWFERERKDERPVIDFFDSESRRIQFIGARGPCSIGAGVPVVYLPDQPHIAAVAPALRNARSFVFMMFIGVALSLWPAAVLL